jgi:hypothetical protein
MTYQLIKLKQSNWSTELDKPINQLIEIPDLNPLVSSKWQISKNPINNLKY